jgi:hypothetical protein
MATVPYSRRIPNAGWERHRITIVALYKTADKTLDEVRNMIKNAGFTAR